MWFYAGGNCGLDAQITGCGSLLDCADRRNPQELYRSLIKQWGGRPKKDADSKAEKKIAYQDNTDRIEVERKFSLAKCKFGLGLLLTKREDTTRASIVLSIIAMNIDRLAAMLCASFVFC